MVENGEFAGWLNVPREPFNDHAGPFFHRFEDDGSVLCGFRTAQHNANGLGIIHGGSLLTFADYCLFIVSHHHCMPDEVVTVSMNSEFMGKAFAGDRLEARGEVVRGGRSLIFVRGQVTGPKGLVLGFSGISKVVPQAMLQHGFSGSR